MDDNGDIIGIYIYSISFYIHNCNHRYNIYTDIYNPPLPFSYDLWRKVGFAGPFLINWPLDHGMGSLEASRKGHRKKSEQRWVISKVIPYIYLFIYLSIYIYIYIYTWYGCVDKNISDTDMSFTGCNRMSSDGPNQPGIPGHKNRMILCWPTVLFWCLGSSRSFNTKEGYTYYIVICTYIYIHIYIYNNH